MTAEFKFAAYATAVAFSLLFTTSSQAQEFMTQRELLATLPGKTATGIDNKDGKTRWTQNYGKGRKKGKIAGLFGKEHYEAKWWVEGNKWCEDWGTGNGCWKFERAGDNKLRVYWDGKAMKNLWTIK